MPAPLDRVHVQLVSKPRPLLIPWIDRDKLIRRIQDLESGKSIIAKLENVGASRPIDLADEEKGFLIVAIRAWAHDSGSGRVPGSIMRLRDGLLDDLRSLSPTEPEREPPVDDRHEVEEASEEPTAIATPGGADDVEAGSRLLSLADAIEHELAALRARDDARLNAALEAMERARSEIVSAVAALGAPPASGR